MIDETYSRQARVREIGRPGQERIAETTAVIASGPGAWVTREYLQRAGVQRVQIDAQTPVAEFAHAGHFTHPVVRAFAEGCWGATQVLTAALGLPRREGNAKR